MRHFQRLAVNVDVGPLRHQLAAHPELWGQHGARRCDGSPHAGSADIWARYRAIDELTSPAAFGEAHRSVWYPAAAMLPAVKAIGCELMVRPQILASALGGVLLTRLPPGGEIKPHVDDGWHARFYEKIYVAVQNGPGAVFGWPSGEVRAEPGEVYWFRNDVPHWVVNGSDDERISMIVCVRSALFHKNYAEAA